MCTHSVEHNVVRGAQITTQSNISIAHPQQGLGDEGAHRGKLGISGRRQTAQQHISNTSPTISIASASTHPQSVIAYRSWRITPMPETGHSSFPSSQRGNLSLMANIRDSKVSGGGVNLSWP